MSGTVIMKGLVFVTEHPEIEPEPIPEVQQETTLERRRRQWRESQRRRRLNLPRKYLPRGARTRAEQLRAASRKYYWKKKAERMAAKNAG